MGLTSPSARVGEVRGHEAAHAAAVVPCPEVVEAGLRIPFFAGEVHRADVAFNSRQLFFATSAAGLPNC